MHITPRKNPIQRASRAIWVLMLSAASVGSVLAQSWTMQPVPLPTHWAASVTPSNALPEYPRPQLVRSQWQNLNGLWEYALTAKDAQPPARYEGWILVPFPLESALSGVQKSLGLDQYLWYRRTTKVQSIANGNRLLLHFDAVDREAKLYMNGREVSARIGESQHFTFDVTDSIQSGNNTVVVRCARGISQTVWLETVPAVYIESLTTTPDVHRSQLRLQVHLQGEEAGDTVVATAQEGSTAVARKTVQGLTVLSIPHPHLWSPDDPFLYGLQVRVLKNGHIIDEVQSYFGMRQIEIRTDAAGLKRIFLNGKYTYNLGVLDLGTWPEGMHTAPTDAALKFDVQAVKALGFNTIRAHMTIRPERWYYYCDTLGVLVWQDMPAPANGTEEARAEFESQIQANLAQLHNHPSITTWVLFNERWWAYDQARLAQWMKQLDPSRLLDAHSGPNGDIVQWERHVDFGTWARLNLNGDFRPVTEVLRRGVYDGPTEWVGGDFIDTHQYPYPEIPLEASKVRVDGEVGGIGAYIDGHMGHIWDNEGDSNYLPVPVERTASAYAEIANRLKVLEGRGLSGSIYTQLADQEWEQDGLMTYDRAVARIPVAELAQANARLVPRARNYAAATRGFAIEDLDQTPESHRYTALLAEYLRGGRDPAFLRSLALMALRQKDQTHATQVGNDLIARLPRPYSRASWAFIAGVTRTSQDQGFELLRTQAEQANAILGPNAAQRVIRKVIAHDGIEPRLADASRVPDWNALEKEIPARYGPLGTEELNGQEMMFYARREDWKNFGESYTRYFTTATQRSDAPLVENLSYKVFEHVREPRVLESAIQVMKTYFSLDTNESVDPIDIDTYAGLLYKAGHRREALQWQEKAVRLTDGQDKKLVRNLEKLQAGLPTWPTF